MADKDKGTLKGGTLSIGSGTLGVKSGGTASRSGVAVEVRKRRTFTPTADEEKNVSSSRVPRNAEEARRLEALEKAKKNSEEENRRREEERKQAEELRKLRTQEEVGRKKQEEERERLRLEQEKAREEERRKQSATAERPQAKEAPRQTLTTVSEENKRRGAGKGAAKGGQDFRKRGRNAYLEDLEQRYRSVSAARRKKERGSGSGKPAEKVIRDVVIPEFITVQELASRMAEKSGDVVKKLMMMGQMVTLTQTIDQETAALVVEEFGHTYKFMSEADIEQGLVAGDDKSAELQVRPPIVTVMGHVDHGKTSLLDALRKTDVAAGEAGGITQHIGAYQIQTKSGKHITFLDTPGHEAFTAMRARGASVTDVVILVVAADDSVMPQTQEAIDHARAAGVPLVVAINKVDKPEADPEKVKQDLLNHDLIPESYGGDVVCMEVSAKTGKGLEELEEMVLLQAEILELKANPNRRADGVVVESRLDKGRGVVASVIIERGTLHVGDVMVAGSQWGRVRALVDDKGQNVKSAGPAMPVEILGLQGVPVSGDTFVVTEDERRAREVAEYRSQKKREKEHAAGGKRVSLDNLMNRIQESEIKQLNIIVKGDVQGSVEAIADSLNKLETSEVKVRAIHSAVGVVTESDVMLAQTSEALIIGFNVRANAQARDLAEREGVEIRYYNVIYDLVNDIKAAMSGLLAPTLQEKLLGHAEVRQIFKAGKVKIAGCMVTDGKIIRHAKARLLRDGVVVHDGTIDTLKRFKDDAKEVLENFECGLTLTGFDDLHEGDVVECYEMEEISRTIDDLKKVAAEQEKAETAKSA